MKSKTMEPVVHSDDAGGEEMSGLFHMLAKRTALIVGSAWAFFVAAAIVVLWAVSGPMFRFSDTWQLVINTGTTIVTFLMVFLIQHTQNRDGQALQLKLDELIRAVNGANPQLIDLEDQSDKRVVQIQQKVRRAASERKPSSRQR